MKIRQMKTLYSIIILCLTYIHGARLHVNLRVKTVQTCFNPNPLAIRQIGNGQFKKITSLAILSPGSPTKIPEANTTYLYVADSGNDAIEKFFINGTFVLKWGSKGTFQGQFYRPTALSCQ